MGMKNGFEKGRNKRKGTPKNIEETKGLLDDNDMEQKDESEELDTTNDNNDTSRLQRYDLGSMWKNMETVFGSSMIHWLIPLDWNEDELYKRMLTRSFSFDLMPTLPCKSK